jgi:hypothetical protein
MKTTEKRLARLVAADKLARRLVRFATVRRLPIDPRD